RARKFLVLIFFSDSEGVSTCTAYQSALSRAAARAALRRSSWLAAGSKDKQTISRSVTEERVPPSRFSRSNSSRWRLWSSATSRSASSRNAARLLGLKKFLSADSTLSGGRSGERRVGE